MHFTVNARSHDLELDPRTSLLDLLRDHLRLPGTKKGCNQGACGACTVLVNGTRINSCLALAVQYQGCEITTVEGLSAAPDLHPLQEAFIEHDGFQCGYCTPGQMCSAIAMVDEAEHGVPSALTADLSTDEIELTRDELRERMSGNLCRCGAHNGIMAAIEATFVERNRNAAGQRSRPDAGRQDSQRNAAHRSAGRTASQHGPQRPAAEQTVRPSAVQQGSQRPATQEPAR